MNSQSLKVIAIGVVVLGITYLLFTFLYNGLAPTPAEFLAAQTQEAVSSIASRSQQAGLVRVLAYLVYLGEIIFFVARFLKSREPA